MNPFFFTKDIFCFAPLFSIFYGQLTQVRKVGLLFNTLGRLNPCLTLAPISATAIFLIFFVL